VTRYFALVLGGEFDIRAIPEVRMKKSKIARFYGFMHQRPKNQKVDE
jgi:hypothetical protein